MPTVSQQPANNDRDRFPDLPPKLLHNANAIADCAARRAREGLPLFRTADPFATWAADLGYREGLEVREAEAK